MQTPVEYINKTESAVRKLFEGINAYSSILRRHPTPVFSTPYTAGENFPAPQFEIWSKANSAQLSAARKAKEEYLAESFAHATLCGAVLQIAAKALECYSKNSDISSEFSSLIKPTSKAALFCTGRLIRGVPLGLVIYAARNQHAHFGASQLREPNIAVLKALATKNDFNPLAPFSDPAFDVQNPGLVSFASNSAALIGWSTYDAYEKDLRTLLEVEHQTPTANSPSK